MWDSPKQVKENFLLKNTDPLHRACAAPQPQLCTSGGLPHCQQLSPPQHVSTTPLHSGASSFVTLRRRKSSGRQRCWQWGRPPKQVKEDFLLKKHRSLALEPAIACHVVSRAARPNKSCTSGHCDPEVELREESRRKRIVSWRRARRCKSSYNSATQSNLRHALSP